jgi:hypothetical protein
LLTLAAAASVALVAAAAARAHVTVTPAFLEAGEAVTVSVEAPNERASHPMTVLALTLPPGLRAEPDGQPVTPGWRLRADGDRATWSGGSLAPDATQQFSLRLRASGEPRSLAIRAEQRYPDGRSVSWAPAFTVLPAAAGGDEPEQYPGRALVAAVIGLLVIGASLGVGRRLRQRSLQEE